MIRRAVKIQLVAFVAIFVLGTLYAGFSLVGLDAVRRPYTVRADFATSGGIFSGAEVTYRGVRVGKVGALHLTSNGVIVDLTIDRGKHIPAAGVTATVADKSAVGEQYVDLAPTASGGPYLRDGDRIERSSTRLPVEISQVIVDLDRLVNTIDKAHLATLIDGLGQAFQGTAPSIQTLIESGNTLTDAMKSVLPETYVLIDEGKTVLDTARATSSQFKSFAEGLAKLTDTLRTSDPDLRRLLDNGVAASHELEGLLDPNQAAIAALVGDLVTVNRIGVARLAGTRQTLVALPEVVKRVPQALINGQLHNGLVVHTDPPACVYDTTSRSPQDRTAKAPDVSQQCTPDEGGKRVSCWATPSGEMASCLAAAGGATLGTLATGYGSYTLTADGRLATVGWEGGQQDVMGDMAWLSLMLAPLQ